MKMLKSGYKFKSVLLIYFLFFNIKSQHHLFSEEKNIQIPEDLKPLLDILNEKGFNVKFEIPPRKNVHGLFESKSKTLWISPISFYEGIGRNVLLHEATHAAQSCPSGFLTPLDLKLYVSPLVRKEVQRILLNNYESSNFLIEKEAFYVQAQKNGVNLLLKSLAKRCK